MIVILLSFLFFTANICVNAVSSDDIGSQEIDDFLDDQDDLDGDLNFGNNLSVSAGADILGRIQKVKKENDKTKQFISSSPSKDGPSEN